jgi:hypothetical protein
MSATADRSIYEDARAPGDRARRSPLPYGEVRVGPREIAIGIESLPHVTASQRTLFERAVAAAGADPADVLVVRVTEAGMEVDAIDPDDADWPVRTLRLVADDR